MTVLSINKVGSLYYALGTLVGPDIIIIDTDESYFYADAWGHRLIDIV